MRMRNNSNAQNELIAFTKYIDNKENLKEIIKGKKVNLEIGMGKGQFIANMALQNKDEIFIGVELCKSVLALAIKKIKRFEEENNVKLNNLYLMSFDAITITEFFDKDDIDTLFLNFSDPWPKNRHSKRRLTHENFLKEYVKVIKKGGYIRFKTDNIKLFEFSLTSINNFGLKFQEVYLNLHNTNVLNVKTEYEEKFSKYGPIYMLICKI